MSRVAARRASSAPYAGVTVDLGAGDGAWAYRYAQAQPERSSSRSIRCARTCASIRRAADASRSAAAWRTCSTSSASVEHVPEELRAIGDEIYVTLPWGSLMRGLMLGDDVVLNGVASLAPVGALVRIVLNTRIFDDPVPIEARDLPEPTPEYVRETLAPAVRTHAGFASRRCASWTRTRWRRWGRRGRSAFRIAARRPRSRSRGSVRDAHHPPLAVTRLLTPAVSSPSTRTNTRARMAIRSAARRAHAPCPTSHIQPPGAPKEPHPCPWTPSSSKAPANIT